MRNYTGRKSRDEKLLPGAELKFDRLVSDLIFRGSVTLIAGDVLTDCCKLWTALKLLGKFTVGCQYW